MPSGRGQICRMTLRASEREVPGGGESRSGDGERAGGGRERSDGAGRELAWQLEVPEFWPQPRAPPGGPNVCHEIIFFPTGQI